jgi:hypothetical protein
MPLKDAPWHAADLFGEKADAAVAAITATDSPPSSLTELRKSIRERNGDLIDRVLPEVQQHTTLDAASYLKEAQTMGGNGRLSLPSTRSSGGGVKDFAGTSTFSPIFRVAFGALIRNSCASFVSHCKALRFFSPTNQLNYEEPQINQLNQQNEHSQTNQPT